MIPQLNSWGMPPADPSCAARFRLEHCATLTHMTHRVGVRALQQNASEVVKRVAAGEVIDITDRGRLVAHMIPAKSEGMQALRSAGLVQDARHSAAQLPPPLPRDPDQPTLGAILAEQRTAER